MGSQGQQCRILVFEPMITREVEWGDGTYMLIPSITLETAGFLAPGFRPPG